MYPGRSPLIDGYQSCSVFAFDCPGAGAPGLDRRRADGPSAPHPTVVATRNAIDQRRIARTGGVELHAHAAIRLLAHAGGHSAPTDAPDDGAAAAVLDADGQALVAHGTGRRAEGAVEA